ncbi:HsmA family protein [Brevibacillus choshinensis]|uniref:TIGR03987 family protein n=1 Tax=Brevibacillus choshinensis TaxID=54911 RepID=A0ABX7FX05_BRECH|nr:HsmA family protein [Brevibacillus choshinensis]QRG70329.1 TIGR03987 family protein [Brevibacillus choshinensis]
MLLFAVIFINLALLSYTIGVWSEKRSGRLKPNHLAYFGLGLFFDTVGTTFMKFLADSSTLNLHGITGLIALVLMFFHTVWACYVLWKKKENQIKQFHTFSLFVWILWLVPYSIGVALSFIK